ncbi:MAG: DUF3795 domain-containing protein [Desulfosporosinus sp.]|nr:DUF3795 domain-containing protein [Desulfosporosinus sp.]
MKNGDVFTLVGPCGIYCGDCEAYKAKGDPVIMEYLISRGFKKEKLPCPGCRPNSGNCVAIEETCETYTCVTEHNVDYCYDYKQFPCSKLNPSADRANILPHNMKVFNLCCIKQQGVENFLEKHSDIKQRYYKGKMVIGKGPQIE